MTDVAEVKQDAADTRALVTGLVAATDVALDALAALKAQVAAGGVATQADLEQIHADLSAAKDAVTAEKAKVDAANT